MAAKPPLMGSLDVRIVIPKLTNYLDNIQDDSLNPMDIYRLREAADRHLYRRRVREMMDRRICGDPQEVAASPESLDFCVGNKCPNVQSAPDGSGQRICGITLGVLTDDLDNLR